MSTLRSHFFVNLRALGLLSVLLPALALANPTPPSATLPLPEVLRLYRENEAKKEGKELRAPLEASVGKLELSGRLLDGAVDVQAHVELSVLAVDGWVTVRLLKKDAATRISRLPSVENAVFAVVDGYLCFLTNKASSYSFDFGFLTAAQTTGTRRRAEISYPAAAMAVLKLRVDEHLFALANGDRIEDGDGYSLYPQGNRFDLQWERSSAESGPKKQVVRRPPIEPVITTAHASVVSTLEGRRMLRVLYSMQLEGTRSVVFAVPARQRVDKVFLNGASIPFKIDQGKLDVAVSPARAGDASARVELLLNEGQGGYALSGRLEYEFPAASWNVNDLFVTLNLPPVFNYQWEGGSLAPSESFADAEYTQRIPTPGKRIHLHQQLLSGSAAVRIAYTVDLSGRFFNGRPGSEIRPDTRTEPRSDTRPDTRSAISEPAASQLGP